MTKQRDLKQRIRARMQKTGERYAAARAQVIGAQSTTADLPGVYPGFERFGGVQGDTGALTNALRQAGVTSPLTGAPFDEAFVNGLCGGPGFLYAVFEYAGHPPMLSLLTRQHSMPNPYIQGGVERLPVVAKTHETGGAATARKALEAALEAGHPALCAVDMALVPWSGVPREMAGMGPILVGIVGRDGEDVWVDDRRDAPRRVPSGDLAKARAAYRKAKHLLIELVEPAKDCDLGAAVRAALAATVRGYREAPIKSFASNFGFNGLEKWARLLTDAKDKKGWPKVFGEGARAYAGLRRAYDDIEYEYTAPAAGRAFYADFLEQAARLDGLADLGRAAKLFRDSGERWRAISKLVVASDPAVAKGCELTDRRAELLDSHDADVDEQLLTIWRERYAVGEACGLTREQTADLYAELAEQVSAILDLERRAVELLEPLAG